MKEELEKDKPKGEEVLSCLVLSRLLLSSLALPCLVCVLSLSLSVSLSLSCRVWCVKCVSFVPRIISIIRGPWTTLQVID